MSFIRVHKKGKPCLVHIDGIFSIDIKLKGIGSVIVDMQGSIMEVDETIDDITNMLGDLDVEIIESAND